MLSIGTTFPQPILVTVADDCRSGGMLYPGRPAVRRSWRLLRRRVLRDRMVTALIGAVWGPRGRDLAPGVGTAAATKSIPVIALTAHAMASDRDRALEAGCDDYDTKPIELPRLLGKIEALLGGQPPA